MVSDTTPDHMIETISRFGGIRYAEHTLDAVLDLIVSLAVEVLVPDGAASITYRDVGGERTISATSEAALAADAAQYGANRGPCLQASKVGEIVDVDLTVPDERWPEFSAYARQQGFVRCVSAPLFVDEGAVGALNLYSTDGEVWSKHVGTVLRLFSEQASIVVANAAAFTASDRRNSELRDALATRETIGRATGIIMAREGIGSDEAFDLLRRTSQNANRKLRDVAREIVEQAASAR